MEDPPRADRREEVPAVLLHARALDGILDMLSETVKPWT